MIIRPVLAVIERDLVKLFRQKGRLLSALVRPLIWLLVIGAGFEALIDLDQGINEVYELIASNRIKDINDPRYSNQSFLQTYGVS